MRILRWSDWPWLAVAAVMVIAPIVVAATGPHPLPAYVASLAVALSSAILVWRRLAGRVEKEAWYRSRRVRTTSHGIELLAENLNVAARLGSLGPVVDVWLDDAIAGWERVFPGAPIRDRLRGWRLLFWDAPIKNNGPSGPHLCGGVTVLENRIWTVFLEPGPTSRAKPWTKHEVGHAAMAIAGFKGGLEEQHKKAAAEGLD